MKFYKMGKHFWTKHVDDEHDHHHHKQPSCMSGLVHALAYHHRRYNNGRKIIHHDKYGGKTGLKGDCIPKTTLFSHDGCEVEEILDRYENACHTTKRCRGFSSKSLRSRVRELASEEMRKGGENDKESEGFSSKSRLQRTYSIHHLESFDHKTGKICSGWKQPIVFLPRKVDMYSEGSNDAFQIISMDENESSCKEPDTESDDVLDVFKVDKELFMKKLQDSEEGLDRFGLNGKEKERLSESRSFPDRESSQRLKFKPSKLEHKQKETWSFPRIGKSSAVNQELKLAPLNDLGMSSGKISSGGKYAILEQFVVIKQGNGRNYYHRRGASLNESLDGYARLFEHSSRTDSTFHPSKSLKITNETGRVPIYFTRIRSLSNVDSYYSSFNFVLGDDETVQDGSNIAGSLAVGAVVEEEGNKVELLVSAVDNSPQDIIDQMPEMKSESESFDFLQGNEDDPIIALNVVRDKNDMEEGLEEEEELSFDDFLSNDSDSPLQERLSHARQLQNSKDRFLDSSESRCKNDSNLRYVRYILDQSGIAENASDRAWHSSDQPLSPQLLEKAQPFWSHESDQFSLEPKSGCCWHHQMLFDLTNEVLIQIYDHSLPYYPKPLSSACHVHPFPVGNHINEDVSTSIRKLLDSTLQEESLDCVMARDLGRDSGWMNLQFESQCVALELDDAIFDELLEEVVQLSGVKDEDEILFM